MSINIEASASSWQSKARQLADAFFAFLFPPVCANCRQVGAAFCSDCVATVRWIQEPICQKCGRLCKRPTVICSMCKRQPLPLHQIRSAVLFVDPIQTMIHKLKYEGMFGLAEPLSDLMFRAWPQWETAVDIVVPIPLHPERQKTRGYNQSERLAHHFGQKIGLPCNNNALERVRYTKPQVGLTAVERLENVDAAFLANPEIAKNKSVLLIDDVCTTGATLTAAANTLLSVGAKKVSAYCLARAI